MVLTLAETLFGSATVSWSFDYDGKHRKEAVQQEQMPRLQ